MPKTNVHVKKMKSLEENLQECINEVVWAENKEDTIYWLGRIHAFMKMADEHDYELSFSVKLEKCTIEEK
ncbi:hypothetical protein A7X95_02660 [Candidatus Nitrosopelagicus brevis]|uniref:Uncharacterized protein n=1 Tax=Candidatus Nitrosopelagicus brevis TaxID=1410606 RepID=A0A2R6TC26_9ARCH|nr:hypothetical protein A7X95_02660 [Candidatus Nitrosopelagicus brevis]